MRSSNRLRRIIATTRSKGCDHCGEPDRYGYDHTPVGPGRCIVTVPKPTTTVAYPRAVADREG